MTVAEFVLVVAAVLCILAFVALIVVLMRVLDSLKALRAEVTLLRGETRPLLDELRATTAAVQVTVANTHSDLSRDLERFDRVLGSAEAISGAVEGGSLVARTALSAPVIKAAGIATGTRRTWSRLRRKAAGDIVDDIVVVTSREELSVGGQQRSRQNSRRAR